MHGWQIEATDGRDGNVVEVLSLSLSISLCFRVSVSLSSFFLFIDLFACLSFIHFADDLSRSLYLSRSCSRSCSLSLFFSMSLSFFIYLSRIDLSIYPSIHPSICLCIYFLHVPSYKHHLLKQFYHLPSVSLVPRKLVSLFSTFATVQRCCFTFGSRES
jgi:hypothetical protein